MVIKGFSGTVMLAIFCQEICLDTLLADSNLDIKRGSFVLDVRTSTNRQTDRDKGERDRESKHDKLRRKRLLMNLVDGL